MKKYIFTMLLACLLTTITNAQSPFQGTWKWENNNQRFYVYIKSETLAPDNKVLSIDYKMVTVNNNVETEIYSSKINNTFFWAGAFMFETTTSASGLINDKTHPNTEDGIEGRFSLELIPQTPNNQPKLKWEIRKQTSYIQGTTTSNPPDEFNLPIDCVLTKM